jgi:60 kDa SS-A/Ro ribonucleoprotein
MLKRLFGFAGKAPLADTKNEAGGRAYAFSPEHALAQYAVTGTMHNTFYAAAEKQLEKLLELAAAVSPEFVAKTAVYCRRRGFMKDVPALLVAYLAKKDVRLMKAAFPLVIDNGKMLRNFVQIIRSGVIGRKSFGTAPKRAAQAWFKSRTPENIFRNSIGAQPSMADVIKMVRPSPKNDNGQPDAVREALYGYLIGKGVDVEKLPPVVRAFEAFKKGEGEVPDVPFEMLTALELTKEHWTSIAKSMTWTQTRMNLNTLLRKGVFEDEAMVTLVAERLKSPDAIRRARAFPYQLLAAFRAAGTEMPGAITEALQDALETATENVPSIAGKIYVCPDVSGSMQSPVTGHRAGATSAVRCVDVAGLVAASLLRRNTNAEVIAFSDDVVKMPRAINPRDSVMTNARYLASLPSGGTACSAPLRHLNAKNAKGDLVLYVSDNQSWADFAHKGEVPGARASSTGPLLASERVATRGTVMAEEWARFRARNPDAKLVLIDLQPYASTQVAERADVLNVGGFSDAVFEIVSLFAKGELGSDHFVGAIQSEKL